MTKRADSTRGTSIAILGMGNWGTSLAHALRTAAIPLSEVIVKSERARSKVRARGFPVTVLERACLDAEIFWLCVPDSAISSATSDLVKTLRARSTCGRLQRPLMGRMVVHSSGSLSSVILREASDAGASVASVHPMMTFPTRVPVPLGGIQFGVEGDIASRRRLNAIIRRLGGEPFALDSVGKTLYHAVATMASPLLASLLDATQQTAISAGLAPRQARRLFEPIAQATLKNVFSRGFVNSFSGPIARRDAAVIDLHLQALAEHPMVAEIYRSLALYGLEAFPAHNRRELRRLLQG